MNTTLSGRDMTEVTPESIAIKTTVRRTQLVIADLML